MNVTIIHVDDCNVIERNVDGITQLDKDAVRRILGYVTLPEDSVVTIHEHADRVIAHHYRESDRLSDSWIIATLHAIG